MPRPVLLFARVLAAALAVFAWTGAAGAQHCWPSAVALVVRDSAGTIADPRSFDEVVFAPLASQEADFMVVVRRLEPAQAAALGVDERGPSLLWMGQGDCRIDIDEVVLRRGGREMRLRLGVHVDTDARPGESCWIIDLPPFQAGTFALEWGDVEGGSWEKPAPVPAGRWRRVEPAPPPAAPE